jgi:hypothetical protein
VNPPTSILQLRHTRARYARVLTIWSLVSIAAGVPLLPLAALPSAVGWQFLIWGVIDLGFAVLGERHTRLARSRPPDDLRDLAEARSLLAALSFSKRLNLLYLATAIILAVFACFNASPSLYGHALGVFVQGGFLTVYDHWYSRAVARRLS